MSSQKNIFAIFLYISIILLLNEIYDLFTISGNFFTSNSIITIATLLATVSYFNYKQSAGNIKYPILHKFLDKIFPIFFGIFLIGFLIYLMGQISQYGFSKGKLLFHQIFTFVVVLFSLVFLIIIKAKVLDLSKKI